ncbi:MAG: hypothetical protein IJS12_08745 [Lachnospiraceae bacterium]|nr:hypothetical protein [Lachnospiraceae bacterium]
MNLKYYLKGLGLGLIVTALVLGIHHARTKNAVMTDAQIKERAAELGMVDGSTRLIEEIPSTEEMLADIQDNDVTDVTSDNSDSDVTSNDSETADQDVDQTETSEDVIADANALLEDTTAEIDTDAPDDPGLDYPTEDGSFTMLEPETITAEPISEAVSETDHEFTPTAGASDSGSSAGSITISSGDSSDRVARKLADAGIVSSAAEYDRFLCSHGYDRILRTGTYSFNAGMSDDEIARMITGR